MQFIDIDLWCDHCHHRFNRRVSKRNTTIIFSCPECAHRSLRIWCTPCDQHYGIAWLADGQAAWICPACKVERPILPRSIPQRLASAHTSLRVGALPVRPKSTPKTISGVILLSIFFVICCASALVIVNIRSQQPQWSQPVIVEPAPKTTTFVEPTPTAMAIDLPLFEGSDQPTGYIVYSSDRDGRGADQLYLLLLSSKSVTRITPHANLTYKRHLVWAEEARELGYITQDSAKLTLDRKKHLYDHSFAPARSIVLNKLSAPALSPDGQVIAHSRNSDGERGLYITNLNTKRERRLTSADTNYPAWTPDSREIIFSTLKDRQYDLQIVDVARGRVTLEYNTPGISEREADWHPRRKTVVFIGSRNDIDELYRYDFDTDLLTQLTQLESKLSQPEWSPDGNHIVFVSNASGNNDLWIISQDGTTLQQLTDTDASEQYPVWMPLFD